MSNGDHHNPERESSESVDEMLRARGIDVEEFDKFAKESSVHEAMIEYGLTPDPRKQLYYEGLDSDFEVGIEEGVASPPPVMSEKDIFYPHDDLHDFPFVNLEDRAIALRNALDQYSASSRLAGYVKTLENRGAGESKIDGVAGSMEGHVRQGDEEFERAVGLKALKSSGYGQADSMNIELRDKFKNRFIGRDNTSARGKLKRHLDHQIERFENK